MLQSMTTRFSLIIIYGILSVNANDQPIKLSRFPSSLPTAMPVKACKVLMQKQQFGEAINSCSEAIQTNPKEINLYLIRGYSYAQTRQFPEAIQDADKAIKLNAKNAHGYFLRCATKRLQKKFRDALPDCNQAITIDPKFSDYYTERGIVRSGLADFEGAMGDIQTAIGQTPDDETAYFWRGYIKIKLNLDRKDACEDIRKSGQLGFKAAEKAINAYCK